MELPFAVDTSTNDHHHHDGSSSSTASSLVTASSQGSLVPEGALEPPSGTTVTHHPPPPQQQQQHTATSSREEMGYATQQQQPQQASQALHPPHLQNTQQQRQPSRQQQQQPARGTASTFSSRSSAGTTATAAAGVALKAAGSRVSSVFSQAFGYGSNSNINRTSNRRDEEPAAAAVRMDATADNDDHNTEVIDFAYINVTDEDEVDIWLDDHNNTAQYSKALRSSGSDHDPDSDDPEHSRRTDILAVLLQQQQQSNQGTLVDVTEQANAAAADAQMAKRQGNLPRALERHTESARLFHEAAVLVRGHDASMANSLLLLSQTQAKSALALKRIVKLRPNALSTLRTNRLRATVRGALSSNTEADISDSQFLGRASTATTTPSQQPATTPASDQQPSEHQQNPVDEMMELERELRDMDMALELGNSIASLDVRTQNRMKSSISSSESFMVVPAGAAASYMSSSSSIILGPAGRGGTGAGVGGGTASVRARANRVQSVGGGGGGGTGRSAHPVPPSTPLKAPAAGSQQQQQQQQQQQTNSLESSWWGNPSSSTASQVLSSSVISLAASVGPGGHPQQQQQPANTKQLMRLMDSLRTLGDENASLLREVEDAEAARMEAKAAKQQMKRFKEEYGKRFAALKEALEKFRKGYPGDTNNTNGEQNPVTSSEFAKSASTADQLQRQEQLIRKLTADLKKEKEESKKKDGALRKYESFYREVKARSAQKAAQRQQKVQQIPKHPNRAVTNRGPSK